jgi:hypothetical protein
MADLKHLGRARAIAIGFFERPSNENFFDGRRRLFDR